MGAVKLTAFEQGMLVKALPQIVDLSLDAGKLLLRYARKLNRLKIHHKPGEGLASEADLASEKLIEKKLKKNYPGFFFLGEEQAFNLAGRDKAKLFEACRNFEWAWVVDPLDGTNNFLNGIDSYAVCIGLLCQGQPVLGVVYRPSTGELYTAIKGKGAYFHAPTFRGKRKLTGPEKNQKLVHSLLATGFSTEKGEQFDWEFKAFQHIASRARGVRRFGSAALDLCWVAQGRLQGFWESGLAPWDMAAAGIICLESGVKMSDFKGQDFHPFVPNILAAAPHIHREIRAVISKMPT